MRKQERGRKEKKKIQKCRNERQKKNGDYGEKKDSDHEDNG